jgi:adenosylmethionine-8-amino-7-oxononanoate aminotransferase
MGHPLTPQISPDPSTAATTAANEPEAPVSATVDASPGGDGAAASASDQREARLQEGAKRHLWMHFTRMGAYEHADIPIIERGEGPWVWDSRGKRYLDGLSGLFVVQAGHGRRELAEAAGRQAAQLGYFPLWSYAHPAAIELADRLAALAPGDINRVFFTTGGSEAVESAWKLARQYFKAIGQPERYKVISRNIAYHGTTMGALSITGVPAIKSAFEPLVPGAAKVANTNFYRAPEHGDDLDAFGLWAASEIEACLEMEGPESVAAVFLEPVQNSGGCFPPPPGYFQKVREICDRHGVLLVSDEVICAFGRLGAWFGSDRFGYQPDMITCAKGMTSGYAPIGALLASDKLIEPFLTGTTSFAHGITFGGHPVSSAVALANLDLFEKEDLIGHVQANEAAFRSSLETLLDLDIVGDVRGEGYFYGIELVRDKATRETFDDAQTERLLRGFLSPALFEAGLICRADDRGDPVIQLAPPLVCEQEHFTLITEILADVLTRAAALL